MTKAKLKSLALGLAIATLGIAEIQAQTPVRLDPSWRVTAVDTGKPGFIWNIFANSDASNRGNSIVRAERDLAGLAVDPAGALLPNLADPNAVGAALAAATPADPTNSPLHFEIAGVINLSKVEGDRGNFPADELEPGMPATDGSTDGTAAEILTYLSLKKGIVTMGINSDDGFSTASGPNPTDTFGRVELGHYIGGRGASDTLFTFEVVEDGIYPFRTVWENGGGDSNIEWFTVNPDETKVLVNDLANDGIPAFRAAAGATVPYVKVTIPAPLPRQMENTSRGVSVVLVDGTVPIKDSSVALQIDGKPAAVTKTRLGNTLTLETGVLEGLHLPAEAHSAVLTFGDTGSYTRTQSWTFCNLENLILPASPVVGENFDSYPEASSQATTVPPGWVATNFTYLQTPGWDLTDITSDAYLDWVLITTETVLGVEDEVMDNDKSQTINGQPVTDWMSGNLLFAASDGRADKDEEGNVVGQIQFVTSKPFNLSAVKDPVLTFSSGVRISGNQTEAMALEYSVDGGTTWLPVIYMQNGATLKYNSDGSYDAVAIFNTLNLPKIPQWPTPGVGPEGGKFAGGILAPVTQALAPYIAERNDTVTARRVEAIRLPSASKKSDVRLRWSHVGACGWEWGIDNVAIYDLPVVVPTVSVLASATLNGSYQPDAGAVPVGPNAFSIPLGEGARFFRLDGASVVKSVLQDGNNIILTY